ncbi:hypothetical protein MKK69_01310 [Methylobacterium sp. J-026]|uniref:hypothetical protein n=1 Tax=Methylobacterium sp. J-026 TaxID=2836624 RepID=UPI001FB920FF|nr:hypothetical protein [Methylobacterium sp. J-026]MCJ2132717.1 hypothetical protein [Methylobacterium sp. J-026]
MPTIHLIDGTEGQRLPVKPAKGAACNGCGYCCAEEPCHLAVEYIGAGTEGPCPALEFEENRAWCGLVRHASRYMDLPNDWADAVLGEMFAAALGAGRGCDADL